MQAQAGKRRMGHPRPGLSCQAEDVIKEFAGCQPIDFVEIELLDFNTAISTVFFEHQSNRLYHFFILVSLP